MEILAEKCGLPPVLIIIVLLLNPTVNRIGYELGLRKVAY